MDKYVRIGKTTAIRTLKFFTRHIIKIYEQSSSKPPTVTNWKEFWGKQRTGLCWMFGKYWWHALGMKELPFRICRPVQGQIEDPDYSTRSSCKPEPSNLACFLWHTQRIEWYQFSSLQPSFWWFTLWGFWFNQLHHQWTSISDWLLSLQLQLPSLVNFSFLNQRPSRWCLKALW